MPAWQRFFSELRRRHVFKVAAAYGVVMWLVVQVAATTFPAFDAPTWVLRVVIALAVLGFPLALVLAYAFELTPDGGVRRTESAPQPPAPASPRRRLTRSVVAGAVLVLALAGGASLFLREGAPAALLDPDRVVVAPFENQTGDPALDPVGRMAADWITQGLSQTELVRVVPTGYALRSFQHVQASVVGADGVPGRAFAEETGAGLVISGVYYREGDSLMVQAQIVDAVRDELLVALDPVRTAVSAPSEAVERLRQQALAALSSLRDPRLRTYALVAGRPPTYEAFRAYADGLQSFSEGDYPRQIEQMERAAALDSSFVLPLLSMAMGYWNMGEEAKCDSIAQLVAHKRERLAPFDQAVLDHILAGIRSDPVAFHKATQRGRELAPGSFLHLLHAENAIRLGRPQETVEVLSGIDPERGQARGVFYWRAMTGALHLLGDHARELKEAQRARRIDLHDPALLLYEARALAAMRRVGEVEERIEARLRLPATGWPDPGILMREVAIELRAHGEPEAARDLLARAVTWYRANRTESAGSAREYEYARTLQLAGGRDEAARILSRLASEHSDELRYVGALGVVAAARGDRTGAEDAARALERWRSSHRASSTLWFQGQIAAGLDEKDRAVALLREVLTRWSPPGYYTSLHSDPGWDPLRGYSPFEELYRTK